MKDYISNDEMDWVKLEHIEMIVTKDCFNFPETAKKSLVRQYLEKLELNFWWDLNYSVLSLIIQLNLQGKTIKSLFHNEEEDIVREPTLHEFWETIGEFNVFLSAFEKDIINKMLDPQFDPNSF